MISNNDLIAASLGLMQGVEPVNKFGRNPDVDAGAEDVWAAGGTWASPATASVVNLASSSANDTAAGTGARTISVTGLDGNYTEVTETLTLNGVSNVATVNGYFIIHRVVVLTAGSGATNAGLIVGKSTASGTPTLISVIAGAGHSQCCIYQVPANKTLLIYHMTAATTDTAANNVSMFARPFGGVFNLKRNFVVSLNGSSSMQKMFMPPIKFSEKTVIKISVTVASNNIDCSADWGGLLFTGVL